MKVCLKCQCPAIGGRDSFGRSSPGDLEPFIRGRGAQPVWSRHGHLSSKFSTLKVDQGPGERACVPPCSHICPTSTRSIPVQETHCWSVTTVSQLGAPCHLSTLISASIYQCLMPTQGLYSIYSFQHEKAALQAIMATRKILHKGLASWCVWCFFQNPFGKIVSLFTIDFFMKTLVFETVSKG